MKKISKIIIIIFMLLITACKTNDAHSSLISTNVIKVQGSGGIVEKSDLVKNNETASNPAVIINNQSENSTNDTNNNQLNNIKNNESNEVSKPDEQMININITIDCKTILDNMNDLKTGYEGFIPKDGMILDNIVLKVKKGTTVLDVLETVNKKYDLDLKIRKSSFGVYVVGIKYIEEKICGNSSGWMYSINDTFPGQSASSYRLKDGDNIKWRFTCKPGDLK